MAPASTRRCCILQRRSAELQPRFFGENLIERRPLHAAVHVAERVQINGNILGAVFAEQPIDGHRDFLFRNFRRQLAYGAVVRVLDFERSEKIAEHFLVRAQQPRLQHMTRERVAYFSSERRLHPRKTFGRRFSLDKNTPQIALVCQSLDRRLVNRVLFRLQESENLRSQRRRHMLKNFVRFHPSAERWHLPPLRPPGRLPCGTSRDLPLSPPTKDKGINFVTNGSV